MAPPRAVSVDVEDWLTCFHSGASAVPTFSCAEFGYRLRRYRSEYSVVSWSALAPSTSITPSLASHCACARSFTDSNVSSSEISSARLRFACSTLISDVAIRISTTLSDDVSSVRWPATLSRPPGASFPPPVTAPSTVA